MKRQTNKSITCAIIAAAASISIAPCAQAESKYTFGVDYGQVEAREFCRNISNCDNGDTSLKAEVGFQSTKSFGIEVGYASLGTLLDARDSTFMATQDSSAITLSAVGLISFTEQVGIYGRLGGARYSSDGSGTVSGIPIKDRTGVTPLYGIGMKFGLNEKVSIRAEYQVYSDISRVDGQKDDVQAIYGGVHFRL